jgi:hypothetical protein
MVPDWQPRRSTVHAHLGTLPTWTAVCEPLASVVGSYVRHLRGGNPSYLDPEGMSSVASTKCKLSSPAVQQL